MAGFFNQQINNGMPGRSWRSFMQHIPGVGGGMYGDDNGMGKGMMPRPASRPLQRAASAGRYGDTHVVHVNPEEIALLQAMGGSGTVNPRTGLLEFFSEGDGPDGTGQEGGAGAAAGGPGSSASPDDSVGPSGIAGLIESMAPEKSAVPFAALGGPIGMGVQTALSTVAQAIGSGINAVTGATNEGAVAGQGVVGPGGGPDADGGAAPNPWGGSAALRPAAPPSPWTSPAYYTYQPAFGRRPRGFLG